MEVRTVRMLRVQPGVDTASHALPMLLEAVACSHISGDYLHVVQSPNQQRGAGDHTVLLC